MARKVEQVTYESVQREALRKAVLGVAGTTAATAAAAALPFMHSLPPQILLPLGLLPGAALAMGARTFVKQAMVERERGAESARRGGKPVLGAPPKRECFRIALDEAQKAGKRILDKYLVGFEVETGEPLWVTDDEICNHGCVFAKTGVGKTLWLESLMFQQMVRGRASGLTFIDAKRDSGTLAHIIFMALITGRIEDLIVVDPLDPVHAYNFTCTTQRADVKARKILRAGLPPISDDSTAKHYDRLASDSIYRLVRAIESLDLSWSARDVAVALSSFHLAYPKLRTMLQEIGARHALVELGHLASSYRNQKGQLDLQRITDNLRGIASELHSIAGGDGGSVFCTAHTDLVLTDAILRGKIVYFMVPRLEEAEGANRMMKVFREDLEVSIGEITSSRRYNLEDPHLVIVDEGASTFAPSWANLFELARKGRFALLFGAQSAGGLSDEKLGLSEAFYERVMANVNLKVMMRVGDNRTATELAEWMGKVATVSKSVGVTTSRARNATDLGGVLDLSARRMAGSTKSLQLSEDEEELVDADELKHEMSAEKGLAWVDISGRIVKMRSFWVDLELSEAWEGREFIVPFERNEGRDSLGLAALVDRAILSAEASVGDPWDEDEAERQVPSLYEQSQTAKPLQSASPEAAPQDEGGGVFKLQLDKKGRFGNVVAILPKASDDPVVVVAETSPAAAETVKLKPPESSKVGGRPRIRRRQGK